MRGALRFCRCCVVVLLTGSLCTAASAQELRHKWVYVSTNLLPAESVGALDATFAQAQAAGYNGVVLTDYKFATPISSDPGYVTHVRAVVDSARKHGLEIIPMVCDIGYESGFEFQDPNLAEAIPVNDAPFTVHGKAATADVDPESTLKNGDFENADGNRLEGWTYQDDPGVTTFVDSSTTHAGGHSLLMDKIGSGNPDGNARVVQEVAVVPFHAYHLSVWVKTEGFATKWAARAAVLPVDTKNDALAWESWSIASTQDWKQYDVVFNSLGNHSVRIYLGTWGGHGGKIWWDNARIEAAGLVNVARRDGCPLTVTGDGGKVYREGVDYERVVDPGLGVGGNYDVWHTPPSIRLTQASSIHDGEHLHVGYYHVLRIESGSVAPCLSEPKLYDLIRAEVERVDALFHPKTVFLGQDEIRCIDWCALCQSRHLTPGQVLADNVRRCAAIVHKVEPKASVVVWSDMFAPNHNAHDNYYLVNGDLTGSWKGLDASMVVANWNPDKAAQSIKWFHDLGNPQILAGFYDGAPDSIVPWLSTARKIGPVDGVMYTTWQSDFTKLGAFAKAAWVDRM